MSSPFHLATEDVTAELDAHRVTPRKLSKHRLTRGLACQIGVQYFTYWDELERSTWEHEEDLTQYGNLLVRKWAGEPVVRGDNTKYRRYRVQVAKRDNFREKGEMHAPTGYRPCCDVRARPSLCSPDIAGSYIYLKTTHAGWQLARVVGLTEGRGEAKSTAYQTNAGPGEAIQQYMQ